MEEPSQPDRDLLEDGSDWEEAAAEESDLDTGTEEGDEEEVDFE